MSHPASYMSLYGMADRADDDLTRIHVRLPLAPRGGPKSFWATLYKLMYHCRTLQKHAKHLLKCRSSKFVSRSHSCKLCSIDSIATVALASTHSLTHTQPTLSFFSYFFCYVFPSSSPYPRCLAISVSTRTLLSNGTTTLGNSSSPRCCYSGNSF